MPNVVKNTTKCNLLSLLCPSRCRGCGELGTVFCNRCKKDMICDFSNICPKCRKKIGTKCEKCKLPFVFTHMVGYRGDLIGRMVEEFKFYGVREMGGAIAGVIDDTLPEIKEDVVIVPLPTIQRHIRERGLDHTLLVAKNLGKMRKWKVEQVLVRNKNTVQIGADAVARKMQAREAYKLNEKYKIDENKLYVLLDDVWTTGASMLEAEKILRDAGATKIGCIAVVSAKLTKS